MATTTLIEPHLLPKITVPAGGIIRVRFRLAHDNFLYGPWEPLYGVRQITMRFGGWDDSKAVTVRDTLPLNVVRPRIATADRWATPIDRDRLDSTIFRSAPDSLHLEAHVPGNQYFRFERPVRYASRYRLSYWYLVAPGTEGECSAKLRQFRDASVWRVLEKGQIEQALPRFGKWVRVVREFRTEGEATHLSLEFRIGGAGDIGEMWVDDVKLESLEGEAVGP